MKNVFNHYLKNKGCKAVLVIIASLILITTSIGFTAAYLISKTETVENTFTSGVDPYGRLTISKAVEHPYGPDYIIPDSIVFKYNIDLGNECAGKTYSGYTADSDGKITLTIPAGGTVTLDEIPSGTHAVIKEQNIPAGFTPKGGATKEADIEQAKESRADYVNVYSPAKADNKVKVKGIKTLEGRSWKDSDKFIFILEKQEGDEWKKIDEQYATKENKNFDFTSKFQNIDFTEVGTYKFRVTEDEGSAGGIVYDTNISIFDVEVTDEDMDGKLEIKRIVSSSENTTITTDEQTKAPIVSIAFNNKYAPAGSAEAFFNITKTMNDTSGQSRTPAGYVFGLYDGDELIAETEATTASGSVRIKKIFTPEDIGKYHWTLCEIPGNEAGIVYDDTKYEIEVNIVDNGDGTISAYVYDYKPDQEDIPPGATNTYDASFENKYDPADAELDVKGDKNLKGRDLDKGEFKFDLYETDSTYDTKDLKPVKTVSNTDTDGSFDLDLTYSKVGTYYYVVKENNSKPLGGITYDDSEYRIKVVVTDAGGELKAKATVTNTAGAEVKKIVFNNTYAPESVKYSISGTKKLTGKTLESEMFRFALYESNSSFSKEKLIGEAPNNKDGSVSFSEITFEREGKYYYIVKELADKPVKNVTYDKTEYHVSVEVKDDKEGKYSKDVSITSVSGGEEKAADSISFNNSYTGPEEGDDPDKGQPTGKSAKTGDKSILVVWIAMMLLSAVGLATVLFMTRRRMNRS